MESLFVDSADGTRLRLGRWGDAERDVLIIPGLAEHAGRYEHVAAALVRAGWRVTVVELRGHGHSGGRRGFVHRWDEYVADVRAALGACPTPPCFIAHSMGGLVALETIRSGTAPRKLVLSNPLIGIRVKAPAVKIAAGRLLSRVWPSLALGNELDPAGISHDKAVVDAYQKDPLIFKTITARWYTEMTAAMTRVHEASFRTPMMMLVGDQDPITDPDISQAFAKKHNGTLRVYGGMLHEVFNEVGKEQVINDMIAWLG